MIYLSNGNRKVKATIFNLPAIKTCKKCLDCHKYCYARKAEKLYKEVLPCRERNFEATKQEGFVVNMVVALSRKRSNIVRIHESGDFYSEKYIRDWFTIIGWFPGKRFYAYTKRNDLFTAEILKDKPENLTLILSIDGVFFFDIEKIKYERIFPMYNGFNKIAIVHETFTNCPAIKDKSVMCGKDCTKCIDGKEKCIIFKKH